ncbi:MAG: PEP-CTERM sorting domain-containing protein [Phycisphaerae bacterium]|jgi:hypothetical protein
MKAVKACILSRFTMFVIGIIILAAPTREAFGILTLQPLMIRLSCSRISGLPGIVFCIIDPLNTESFQLHFKFDTNQADFVSLDFVDPFAQIEPADFTQLSQGIIGNIKGSTSTPPEGEADIFAVTLQEKVIGQMPTFGAYACPLTNDYVVVVDTITGEHITVGAESITPCSIPEPATFLLSSIGVGLVGWLKRQKML